MVREATATHAETAKEKGVQCAPSTNRQARRAGGRNKGGRGGGWGGGKETAKFPVLFASLKLAFGAEGVRLSPLRQLPMCFQVRLLCRRGRDLRRVGDGGGGQNTEYHKKCL